MRTFSPFFKVYRGGRDKSVSLPPLRSLLHRPCWWARGPRALHNRPKEGSHHRLCISEPPSRRCGMRRRRRRRSRHPPWSFPHHQQLRLRHRPSRHSHQCLHSWYGGELRYHRRFRTPSPSLPRVLLLHLHSIPSPLDRFMSSHQRKSSTLFRMAIIITIAELTTAPDIPLLTRCQEEEEEAT